MEIKYSPVFGNRKIEYELKEETIIASVDGKTDTFDFSSLPDGKLEEIKTTLPINPICNAARVNGNLRVELINYIDEEATYEERFPDWQVIH